MITKIHVVGNTHKSIRCNLNLDGEACGNLQIERSNFTKFCELMFGETGYTIGEQEPQKQEPEV